MLENFFESGWMYFYKLVLEILCRLEEQILESNNIAEILTKLKPYSIGQRNWKTFVKNLEKNHERLT